MSDELAIYDELDKYGVPSHCRESVVEYILNGRRPGAFLHAVFSNDLVEAYGRADEVNERAIRSYVMFLYNAAPIYPARCWGSATIVEKWMDVGGLRGLLAQTDSIKQAAEALSQENK